MSGYVCREHLDEPVTWRGTGCTICRIETFGRLAARDHRDTHSPTDQPRYPRSVSR